MRSLRQQLTSSGRVLSVCAALVLASCNVPANAPPPAQPTTAAQPANPTSPPAAAPTSAGAPAPTAAAAAAGANAGKPIVIGVSQALTGDKSDGGTAIEHGYQVWLKEINDGGGLLGRPVQLKDYDNNSLADTSVSQYERLITADKVDL